MSSIYIHVYLEAVNRKLCLYECALFLSLQIEIGPYLMHNNSNTNFTDAIAIQGQHTPFVLMAVDIAPSV